MVFKKIGATLCFLYMASRVFKKRKIPPDILALINNQTAVEPAHDCDEVYLSHQNSSFQKIVFLGTGSMMPIPGSRVHRLILYVLNSNMYRQAKCFVYSIDIIDRFSKI